MENPYMRKGAPGASPSSMKERVVKELKTNWWLWGSIVFAVLLLGSLVVFRESLYDSAKHGLPFLAGKVLPCLSLRASMSLNAKSSAINLSILHYTDPSENVF